MKKALLIYNPVSGDASFKSHLDTIVEKFQNEGYILVPVRTSKDRDIKDIISHIDDKYCMICASGGDGTINSVINAMMFNNIDLPLGIFPYGTSNDFATHLGIPRDINACCSIILNGKIRPIDVGLVNDKYFINVCSAGLLMGVAYKTDIALKNALGKLAYYIKGIEELPRFSSIKMRLETKDSIIEDEMLLFLILNGRSAGGFHRLAPYASIDDGLMDVIAVRASNVSNMFSLFLKVLWGEHVGDPNIYHFQTDYIKIDCATEVDTDIDGEKGPEFPLLIEVKKRALKVFAPV